MANYNIVVDTSNFKPFDFNTTLQVLHDYRDAYDKQQAMLDKIAEAKGLYQITPEMDEEFSSIMDKYNQDFEAAAADFSTGMTAENRAILDSIRRRYASEIMPIQKAAESYNAYVDSINQLNANSKGNALINNPYKLRDFLGGIKKSIDYRDASTIRDEAANITQGILRVNAGDPDIKSIYNDMYHLTTYGAGIGKDDVMNMLASKYGDKIHGILAPLNDYYNNLGINNWTPENQSRAWNAMITGAMGAIPERKQTLSQNPDYITKKEGIELDMQRKNLENNIRKMDHDIWLGQQENARAQGKYNMEVKDWQEERELRSIWKVLANQDKEILQSNLEHWKNKEFYDSTTNSWVTGRSDQEIQDQMREQIDNYAARYLGGSKGKSDNEKIVANLNGFTVPDSEHPNYVSADGNAYYKTTMGGYVDTNGSYYTQEEMNQILGKGKDKGDVRPTDEVELYEMRKQWASKFRPLSFSLFERKNSTFRKYLDKDGIADDLVVDRDGNYVNSDDYTTWNGSGNKLTKNQKDNMKSSVRARILAKAREQIPGIQWDDLDIWEDHDWNALGLGFGNDNEYRVTIKDSGVKGAYNKNNVIQTNSVIRGSNVEVPDSLTVSQDTLQGRR